MAVKHIKAEYERLACDYHELVLTLEDMQNEGCPESQVENIKEMIAGAKANFERWSYMMYLLNLPNRKEKQKRYKRQYGDMKSPDIPESEKTVKELKEYDINGQ